MRALSVALALIFVAACASTAERTPPSPAERASPEADPVLLGTPAGAPRVLPIEQVSVRVRRAADGRVAIVEFLSPGLPEQEQVALRLALDAGELKLAGQGAPDEESWVTTLLRTRTR
jgi:hypothetical protein